MSGLSVFLFGRFCVQRGTQVLPGFEVRKVQELLSYLLLHRGHPHSREVLAGLLWGDSSTEQSKKYLRQALWQLQTALDVPKGGINSPVLLVEPEWVDLDPKRELWVDAGLLEEAFASVEGIPSQTVDAQSARAMQEAVQLYRGDLLEGCYLDWCVNERARLQTIYLILLDKLMGYCEARREYEAGLDYGMRILGYDRASERTHRRLMRLHYLAGDRRAALRQYHRCVAALDEELDVRPSERTEAFYEQIRADRLESAPATMAEAGTTPEPTSEPLSAVLGCLNQVVAVLTDLQQQVQQHIAAVDLASRRRR
jgi:DNA-binding SARP family transcriptional activator